MYNVNVEDALKAQLSLAAAATATASSIKQVWASLVQLDTGAWHIHRLHISSQQ